ncbi:MAG: NHL repeat-containing protein [Planctomycetes bacterium]|nr:NHL repeat-containing protein [Planctomycetota bacterium]
MKNLWIAIAAVSALACGFLGYKIANRKPMSYAAAAASRPGPKEVEDVIASALIVPENIMIGKESARFATGLKELRALAVGPDDRIYAGGDKVLVVLGSDGKQVTRIDLDKTPNCVAVGPDSTVYVGFMDHVEVFDAKGARQAVWAKPGPTAWITSIAVAPEAIYVADFGDKSVYRCDKSGKVLGMLGEMGPTPGSGKYEVPSPYFDVAVDASGKPWVAHVGKQRLESYKADGSLDSTWGKQGNNLQGFSGCCNPSHIVLRKDGSFVTSEKGLVRVKIHNPAGELVGVVAAAKEFEKNIHGLDLAVDSKDRILVLDPATSSVRVYVLKGSESNP